MFTNHNLNSKKYLKKKGATNEYLEELKSFEKNKTAGSFILASGISREMSRQRLEFRSRTRTTVKLAKTSHDYVVGEERQRQTFYQKLETDLTD